MACQLCRLTAVQPQLDQVQSDYQKGYALIGKMNDPGPEPKYVSPSMSFLWPLVSGRPSAHEESWPRRTSIAGLVANVGRETRTSSQAAGLVVMLTTLPLLMQLPSPVTTSASFSPRFAARARFVARVKEEFRSVF